MNLAIIPARGGSKRIPAKNMREFAGKPLIAYSIEAAKKSALFDHIWVSTDCEDIAKVAIEYGAQVPFMRPESLSDDYTGTRPVTSHAIEYCIEHVGKPEFSCCIYATAPFLQPQYLIEGLNQLQSQADKSFAFSVTSFAFPVQRALSIENSVVAPMYPQMINQRSQDLVEAYHDAGQFYWGRTDDYLTDKAIFSQHSVPVVLPRHLVQDIDTLEDWRRAELMYRAYMEGKTRD